MKKLVLIDGSGFIFRAYHAIQRPLTRSDGTPVTAVYGFVTMIFKLMQDMPADYMAVIFDAGRQTFRNRIYSEYKAHRPPPPDDLIPQFALVREATEALGLPSIELADYEADDLIATYTGEARRQGMEVVIVSSDKDLMQLIGEGVTMYDAMKGKPIGPEQVREKFGVGPEKVRHVLALIGDTSDNIPGVPGIGPKTAAELINEHGDIENLLANLQAVKQPKRRDILTQHAANARLSYELIGLCETVPLPAGLDTFALRERDTAKLLAFLHAMEFKTLAARLSEKTGIPVSPPSTASMPPAQAAMPTQYELVRDEAALARWVNAARMAGYVALDTETTSLDAMEAELVGFSLSIEPGKACYVPLGHLERVAAAQPQGNLFESGNAGSALAPVKGQIEMRKALDILLPLLADPAVLIIGHNVKYDMLVMQKYDAHVISPLSDTMLLSYVLGAGLHNHNMDDTAQRNLGHKTISFNEVTGTGKARISFAEVTLEKALAYAAEDADITLRLWKALTSRLIADHMVAVYETIERPLIAVLVAMEARGIKVDPVRLQSLSEDFTARIAALETDIHGLAGQPFNIGSPKQLGEILFEKMGYSGGKKSGKSGGYSTDAAVLEELAADGLPLPSKILEWRQLSKLKNTYTDALAQQINRRTGRVHTSFAMAVTSTGRLSSSDPNLQNIPIRTEEGRKIRSAFVAEPGNRLISADYSQIELRLLAHIADMPSLKDAFRNGGDIHALTASQMFGVALGEVNSDLRRKAKTINFGIIYGISAHGLAVRLGIPRGEAASYIEAYFQQYPGIREYMERTKAFARGHGYVTTLFGRKCFLPGIHDKNPSMRAFSERAAINAPLQGTAADIIKRAMIAVDKKLQGTGSHMLLQVHDELVVEAPEADAKHIAAQVKSIMEGAAHLSVPLTVDTRIGENWHEAH